MSWIQLNWGGDGLCGGKWKCEWCETSGATKHVVLLEQVAVAKSHYTSTPTLRFPQRRAGARRACSAEDWEQEQVQTSESHPRCWFPRRCPCLWTGFAVGVPSMIMHEDAIYNLVFHLALRRRPESGLEICQRQRHPLGRRRRGTHLILVS